jgi:hypothetical protein
MIRLRLISWPDARKHVLRTLLTMAGIVLGIAGFVGGEHGQPVGSGKFPTDRRSNCRQDSTAGFGRRVRIPGRSSGKSPVTGARSG